MLGSGAFAEVRLAKHTGFQIPAMELKSEFVAIKVASKENLRVIDEARAMRDLNHDHILPCYEQFEDDKQVYFILPFCSGGDLLDFVNFKGYCISESEAREIMFQLATAICYAKSKGWCHRDLKLDNILLREKPRIDRKPHCYIADWGLCTTWHEYKVDDESVGSLPYCCPEIVLGHTYRACDADVWSLGCILYALLGGKLPFHAPDPSRTGALICAGVYQKLDRCSDVVNDLISKMLTVSPRERISIEKVLNHPWFGHYNARIAKTERSSRRLSIMLSCIPPPEFTAPPAPLSSGRRRISVCSSNPTQQIIEEENKKPSTFEKLKNLLRSSKKRSDSTSPTREDDLIINTTSRKIEL